MASAFILPKQTVVNGSGVPYAGANLYLYAPNTTTPIAVYTTPALDVPASNPLTANDSGRFDAVYVDDAVYSTVGYKLETAAGTLLESLPEVPATTITSESVGKLLFPWTAAEQGAGSAVFTYTKGPGDIRRYGASTTATASTNAAAVQAALDGNGTVYVPDGTFDYNVTLNYNDGNAIHCESRNAVLRSTFSGSMLRAKNYATTRRYRFQMWSGTLDGGARTKVGGIGIDLWGATMCKFFGTEVRNVETGIRAQGDDAPSPDLGSFYNEFHGVDILTVDVGYEYNTLGNQCITFGGRVNDSEIGVRINDTSGHAFYSMATEAFTTYAYDIAPSTATQYIQIVSPRIENTPSVGTGIRLSSNAQSTMIFAPQFVGLTTNIADSGVDTMVIGPDQTTALLRLYKLRLRNSAGTSTLAHLYATGSSTVAVRDAADSAAGDLVAGIVTGSQFKATSASTGTASQTSIGNTTQSTVGSAGAASSLPANPLGYIKGHVGTTAVVIPYYNP